MASPQRKRESSHPWVLRLVIVAVAVAIALFVRSRIDDAGYRIAHEPQRLTLLDDTPPEPPQDEMELEPEQPEEAIELEQVESLDELNDDPATPAGEMLGLDAIGMAGSDAFGLAARRGGRDLLNSGDGSLSRDWYASTLTAELHDHLLPLLDRHEDLRSSAYSVVLRIWLAPDGRVGKFTLTSTGDAELDRQLRSALEDFNRVRTPPPADMPQPVRVRLLCRT